MQKEGVRLRRWTVSAMFPGFVCGLLKPSEYFFPHFLHSLPSPTSKTHDSKKKATVLPTDKTPQPYKSL
jgi:hypothetical protein